MEVLGNIPVEFSSEEVLKKLHLDPRLTKRLEAEDLVKTATAIIDPKALYTTGYVTNREGDTTEIEGIRLASRVLARNLEKVERVFPYIITIGRALEDEASARSSILQKLFLESTGDLAVTSARAYLERHLAKRYALGGVSHMGPGQLDWPVAQQKQLFSFFEDVEAKVGVSLTESFMMIPRKSISGIIFPTEVTFTSCQLCPRENCGSRQTAYSESLRRSYGLGPE